MLCEKRAHKNRNSTNSSSFPIRTNRTSKEETEEEEEEEEEEDGFNTDFIYCWLLKIEQILWGKTCT
jgi:hypothetical protein